MPPNVSMMKSDGPPTGLRIGLIVSLYNRWITEALENGAVSEFRSKAIPESSLELMYAPGAFELASLAAIAARSGRFDVLVCLGCIIRGETRHDRVIADAVAGALAEIPIHTGVPATLGVLTVDSAEQAEARAGGELGNKGTEAMAAAIQLGASLKALSSRPR